MGAVYRFVDEFLFLPVDDEKMRAYHDTSTLLTLLKKVAAGNVPLLMGKNWLNERRLMEKNEANGDWQKKGAKKREVF